jgi:hypothetical protein
MARFHSRFAMVAAAALLAALGAAPARAEPPADTGHAERVAVWLSPGLGLADPAAPALMTLPPGWTSGDAIVVLTPAEGWPAAARERLTTALLDSGAGVLALNRHDGAQVVADLGAALDVAHSQYGAGLIVALGYGTAGDAALSVAARAVTPEGSRYAGALRLGPGRPDMRFAAAPPIEAWPERAALLCDLLAEVERGDARAFAEACRAGVATLR